MKKKEKTYLQRILNVLPVKIRWMLMKQERCSIDSETLDRFFNWYMNEKRIYCFMDSAIRPISSGQYNIVDIDYELRELGSMFTYTLEDKVEHNTKVNYTVYIREGMMRVVRKATKDNFTKSYFVKILGEYIELDDEIDPLLFTSLKDLMYFTLLAKLDAVYGAEYKKEDIYEAIPCWLK